MTSKVEKLKARQAKELERAQFEDEIRELLPEGCKPTYIHKSSLYGREALVTFKDHYSREAPFGLKEALQVAFLLPANVGGMAFFVNGASYIVPAFHLDDTSTEVHRKGEGANSEPLRMDPVMVTIPAVGNHAQVGWHHQLSNGVVIKVEVELPSHHFGRREIEYHGAKHAGADGRLMVKRDQFFHSDLGSNWGYIEKRFSSGSHYPCRHVIGFPSLDPADNLYRADYVMSPHRLFSYMLTRG